MSSFIVEVCTVDEVRPHPNADRMAVAVIKGWEVCIRVSSAGKPQFNTGDRVVYFPPDTVMPNELAEKLGVIKYLKHVPISHKARKRGEKPTKSRIRVANLRGFKSFGLAIEPELDWPIGTDVSEFYQVYKYETPENMQTNGYSSLGGFNVGGCIPERFDFPSYQGIENYKNFPKLIEDNEEVILTAKIHGTNCRLGYLKSNTDNNPNNFEYVAGSHARNRREYDKDIKSLFWKPYDLVPTLKESLKNISEYYKNASIVLYGEIYGSNIQDLEYSCQPGEIKFKAFDIMINNYFVEWSEFEDICQKFNIPMVNILYRGPFNREVLNQYTNGQDDGCIREGVVIKLIKQQERYCGRKKFDRVILKNISFDYLNRDNGTEYH